MCVSEHLQGCVAVQIASKYLAVGERAPPRPAGESPRRKGRKEDWRRQRGDLDPQDLSQIDATAMVPALQYTIIYYFIMYTYFT